MNLFALGQRVTNFEDAVVWQSHDVAGVGFFDSTLALRHKLGGRREAYRLAVAHMQIGLIAHKLARAYLAEGDARTVVGVDVGCDFEDESRELGLFRTDDAFFCLCGLGAWRNLYKAVEQFLNTEVVECRAKEHRCHLSR